MIGISERAGICLGPTFRQGRDGQDGANVGMK